MKVLWLVNPPFPALQRHLGVSFCEGSWYLPGLANVLCQDSSVTLGIATTWPTITSLDEFKAGGIAYYALPPGYKFFPNISGPFLRAMRIVGSFLQSTDRRTMGYCHELVQRFRPDLIHVHGSEEAWGLIARECNVPIMLSMQGVLHGCLPAYWGTCPLLWRILMPHGVKYWLEWRLRRVPREREIFKANRYFLGRTYWDQAWQQALQPDGRYWHCGELLRREFHEATWQLDGIERFALYSTTSIYALKGTDVLIRAMALLCQRYPLLRLRIGGELPDFEWGAYLRRLVRELRLEKHVSFLGYLDARQIAEQLCRAHVYVLPSHVENSSNSLCEAQLVGAPCVASCVGGVPSLVEHGHTGLLFPRGDHAALAGMVSRIFDDDESARTLGARARAIAQRRHAPELVAKNLLRAYREVIQLAGT
jgi:L-malate glycosyltransferase